MPGTPSETHSPRAASTLVPGGVQAEVWSYYCRREEHESVLLIGSAMEAKALADREVPVVAARILDLDRSSKLSAEVRPGVSFVDVSERGSIEAQPGWFSLVAVHDVGAVTAALYPDRPLTDGAVHLCREVRRLLQPDGEYVMNLRSNGLRARLTDRRGGVSPSMLLRALSESGLTVARALRMRADIDGASLYEVEPLNGLHGSIRDRIWTQALVRLRAPALSFIGHGPAAQNQPSVLSRIVARASGVPPGLTDPRLLIGSFSVCVAPSSSVVVRIPFDQGGADHCARNASSLDAIARCRLPVEVPRSLGRGSCGGITYFAETRVGGHSVDPLRLSVRRRRKLAEAARETLERLQRATMSRLTMTEAEFRRLFRRRVEELELVAPVSTSARLRACLDVAWVRLRDKPFTAVLTHGDFKCGNIMWKRDGTVEGLIDWDMAVINGLPLVDYLTYLAWDRQQRDNTLPAASFADAVLQDPGVPEHHRFCEQVLGLTPFDRRCYTLMTLISFAAGPHGLPWFSSWYRGFIGDRLDVACDRFLEVAAR